MEKVSSLAGVQLFESENQNPIMDTSFVLFFLGVEIGRTILSFSMDTGVLLIALIAVGILPFFLAYEENLSLGKWLLGRGAIAAFALLVGALFNKSVGIVFPEALSFLPFALLILTAMLSCYIQFHNFFKFRLSK